jgi:membrane protein
MAADQQTGAVDRRPRSAVTDTTKDRASSVDADDQHNNEVRTESGRPAERGDGRGRDANRPSEITVLGWKDIFWRLWEQFNKDRILLVAAGATFYMLLALFPALTAFVSIYGFVADPATVADHVAHLGGLLPREGLDIIQGQLQSLARQNNDSLSIGFFVGFLVALWSANSGIKTVFDAMNIAYEEDEKRGFFHLNLLSLSFTVGVLLIGIAMILAVGIIPALLALLNLDAWAEILISVARWPILMLAIIMGISLVYRFGPSREKAKWRWLTWGAVLATLVWVGASWLFSFYLQNFADYNATYGSLGAVIGLMMWTWISVIILIVGAAINAEMEHQTARDTTTGDPLPMGERGAYMADTLGRPTD